MADNLTKQFQASSQNGELAILVSK